MLSVLLFTLSLLPAQDKITKKVIVTDTANDEKIVKIITTDNDTTMHVSFRQDGDEKELELSLSGKTDEEIKKMLADNGLDWKIFNLGPDRIHAGGASAWLGVHIQDLTDQLQQFFNVKGNRGVLVSEVVPDSPAEQAGLEAGDVITAVDGEPIEDTATLRKLIRAHKPETEVTITYVHNKKEKTKQVTLGKSAEPAFLSWSKGDFDHQMLLPGDHKFEKFMFIKPDMDMLPGLNDPDEMKKEIEELRQELEKLKEEMEKLK